MKWVVITPQYDAKSNGVLLLFKLGQALAKLGEQVAYHPQALEDYDCYPHLLMEGARVQFTLELPDPEDTICIVNDATPSQSLSRLDAYRKVWFLLNKPMFITHELVAARPEDFIVAYSRLISTCYLNLFSNMRLASPPALLPHNKKERKITFYVGKGFVDARSLANLLAVAKEKGFALQHITRKEPRSKDKLYDMLRSSMLLVSFDPLTNIIYEAVLNGTAVYVPGAEGFIDYQNYNVACEGVFTDPKLIANYLEKGLSEEQFKKNLSEYEQSLSITIEPFRHFVEQAKAWFDACKAAHTTRTAELFKNECVKVAVELERLGGNPLPVDVSGFDGSDAEFRKALDSHNANRLRLMQREYTLHGAKCSGGSARPYDSFLTKLRYDISRFLCRLVFRRNKTVRHLKLTRLSQACPR
jgi:hypothetical protein